MTVRTLSAVLVLMIFAACNGASNDATREAGNEGASYESPRVPDGSRSGSGWESSITNSGIDGDVLTAFKVTRFGEAQSLFEMVVTCRVASQQAEIRISSVVGDPQNPSERSHFAEAPFGLVRYSGSPSGRIKVGGANIVELHDVFTISGQYGNHIVSSEMAKSTALSMLHPDLAAKGMDDGRPHSDEINFSAALMSLLPMIAEVSNGAGTFELSIENAPEVRDVLTRCGGDRDILERYWDRAAAEASAKQEAAEAQERERIARIRDDVEEARVKACVESGQLDTDWHAAIDAKIEQLPSDVQADIKVTLICQSSDINAYASDPSCTFPPARYPPSALRSGISGTAIVEIQIGPSGEVTGADIYKSARNRELDRAALLSAGTAACTPAIINGRPVSSAMRTSISFNLD